LKLECFEYWGKSREEITASSTGTVTTGAEAASRGRAVDDVVVFAFE
jgi:hypothetical protein